MKRKRMSEAIYDCTGGTCGKKLMIKFISAMQFWAYSKNSLVTKREENSRSHPEHGRKDSLRWQYLEGYLPGR